MATKQKVLLIEDEPSLATMYEAVFRNTPFQLISCGDAKKGMELALSQNPNLILLDIIIPKGEGNIIEFNKRVGFELLADLKKNKKTKSIPVIALTNLDSPEDRQRSEKLGAQSYIIKANFLPKEIVDKVEDALKKF